MRTATWGRRTATWDGHPVRRLADFLGTLRAVVFCTEDLQLVKGAGQIRRRFLDLLLSQTRIKCCAQHVRAYTQSLCFIAVKHQVRLLGCVLGVGIHIGEKIPIFAHRIR